LLKEKIKANLEKKVGAKLDKKALKYNSIIVYPVNSRLSPLA